MLRNTDFDKSRIIFKEQLRADKRLDTTTRLAWLLFDLSAKYGYSFMTVQEMGRQLDVSPRTIQRTLRKLVDRLCLYRCDEGGKRGKTNRYYPIFVELAGEDGKGEEAEDGDIISNEADGRESLYRAYTTMTRGRNLR